MHKSDSAPGFAGAMPAQAAGTLTGPEFAFRSPACDSATFSTSYKSLDSLVVRSMREQASFGSRRAPRFGVATSTQGRATDVDADKAAPYRGDVSA